MISFAEFPIKVFDYKEAIEIAQRESIDHPDWFIYVFYNLVGHYTIDFQGLSFSGERLVITLRNGLKQ